jgi:hypothetical protein
MDGMYVQSESGSGMSGVYMEVWIVHWSCEVGWSEVYRAE